MAILIDASLKGLAILLLAVLITAVMRKHSAAARHMVWAGAVVAVLTMPVLSVLLPGLAVLPSPVVGEIAEPTGGPTPQSDAVVAVPEPSTTKQARMQADHAPLLSGHGSPRSSGTATDTAATPESTTTATPPTEPWWQPWLAWLPWVWLGGAVFALIPLGLGWLSLWHLKRTTQRITGGSWQALLSQLTAEIGMNRPVVLLKSPCRTMPMTWGALAGVIPGMPARVLIPEDAYEWSAERRRAVLLHELAHIQRRDCLTQLLTQFACALYWFNPLMWYAAQRMLIERERACDDLVLSHNTKSSDYAQHLLEIATGPQAGIFAAHAGIAMARRSKLDGRLVAILDQHRNRRAMTRLGVALTITLIGAVAVPVAMLQAEAALPVADEDLAQNESSGRDSINGLDYAIVLPSGATVALVCVSDSDPRDMAAPRYWRPDGSPGDVVSLFPEEKDGPSYRIPLYAADGEASRRFLVRFEDTIERYPTPVWEFPGSLDARYGPRLVGLPKNDGRNNAYITGAVFPSADRSSTIRLGIPVEDWQDSPFVFIPPADEARGQLGRQHTRSLGHTISINSPSTREDGLVELEILHDINHQGVRVVAVDQEGALHTPEGSSVRRVGDSGWQLISRFNDVPLAQIKHFKVQTQQCEWVEFRNVSLQPGHETEVEVVVEPTEMSARQGDAQSASPTVPQGDMEKGPAFGPETEIFLRSYGSTRQSLDLDESRIHVSPFTQDNETWDEVFNWIRRSSTDLHLSGMPDGSDGLFGVEMVVLPVANDAWQNMTAEQVRNHRQLRRSARVNEPDGEHTEADWSLANTPLNVDAELPATFLFRTREDGYGILQITGFQDEPAGVKLRYKQVERPQVTARAFVEQFIDIVKSHQFDQAREMIHPAAPVHADIQDAVFFSNLITWRIEKMASDGTRAVAFTSPLTNYDPKHSGPAIIEAERSEAEESWIITYLKTLPPQQAREMYEQRAAGLQPGATGGLPTSGTRQVVDELLATQLPEDAAASGRYRLVNPDEVAQAFIDALVERDVEQALRMIKSTELADSIRQHRPSWTATWLSVRVASIHADDGAALAITTPRATGEFEPQPWAIYLHRHGLNWRINAVEPAPEPERVVADFIQERPQPDHVQSRALPAENPLNQLQQRLEQVEAARVDFQAQADSADVDAPRIDLLRELVASRQRQFERVQLLLDAGRASPEVVEQAQQALIEARLQLAAADADGQLEAAAGEEPARQVVYITGPVGRPGAYVLPEDGMTLLQLIALVDNVQRPALPAVVEIVRQQPDGSERRLPRIRVNELLEGEAGSPRLQAGDVVIIRQDPETSRQRDLDNLRQQRRGFEHPSEDAEPVQHLGADLTSPPDEVQLDATSVKAHPTAATGCRHEGERT